MAGSKHEGTTAVLFVNLIGNHGGVQIHLKTHHCSISAKYFIESDYCKLLISLKLAIKLCQSLG